MRHIRILVCRVDDETPEQLTELARFDLLTATVERLPPETALDELEARTQQTGHAVLRQALQAQWDLLDEQAPQSYSCSYAASTTPCRW
jgi:hypothetical protein